MIALTGRALADDAQKCLAAGMDDYLAKPLDPAAFDAALARWLAEELDEPERPARRAGQQPAAGGQDGQLVDDAVLDRLRGELGQAALERLIELFLGHTDRRLERLTEAIAAGDLDGADRLAHTIKGGAQPLGAARLAQLCQQLETTAADRDHAQALADRLREAFDATRAALERQAERPHP